MRSRLRSCSIALLLATGACAGGSGGEPAPNLGTRVRIENRSSSDMDIYVRPALSRATRLGFVPGSDTATFALARAVVSGSTSFFLEARPVRTSGSPAISEPFTARAGEEIFWSIPPQ